jgi:hypothetical protein
VQRCWILPALGLAACSFTPTGDRDAAVDATDAPIDARPCGPDYVDGYRYYATQATWLDAERECERATTATLAVLDTPAARAAAVAAAQRFNSSAELWVGLVRDQSGAAGPWAWHWVTGGVGVEPLGWSLGQPDNGGDQTQYVVRMERDTGAIYDRDFTDASLRALCQCDGRPPVNADYDPATP